MVNFIPRRRRGNAEARPDPELEREMMAPHTSPAKSARPEHRFALDPATVTLLRGLMTGLAMHRSCPRKDCRRARACAAPAAPCFWINREALQETVWPKLRALAGARTDKEGP